MLYHEVHSPENVMPTSVQDRSETLFLNGFVGLRFDAARAHSESQQTICHCHPGQISRKMAATAEPMEEEYGGMAGPLPLSRLEVSHSLNHR